MNDLGLPVPHLQEGDALLIVDVQNDFLPGGRLPVPWGHEVVSPLNGYIAAFEAKHLPIFATRDWHPRDHCSFTTRDGPWPPHCIAGTVGAAFVSTLALPRSTQIFSKGSLPDQEAYSGFQGTDLDAQLRRLGVQRLFIGGLATDYSVLNTVKDALAAGYTVFLLHDAVRPVNARLRDGIVAEQTMYRLGAIPVEQVLVP